MNFKKHSFTILIIILIIVSVIFYSLKIFYNINISTENMLAIGAIIITFVIAYTQDDQLKKLTEIGFQTKKTAEKLRTEALIQDTVTKFFITPNNEKNKHKKYKILFPVEYKSKPLPLINQGDFYAMHILGTRLRENNFELKRIAKEDSIESIDENLLKDNVIFVCAPLANIALRKIFKMEEIKNDADEERLKNWPLEELKLPCWFLKDYRNTETEYPNIKIKIFDKSIEDLLISPAQKCYDDAGKLNIGQRYECDVNIQRDHGIFARLNQDGNQYIIIAGLHQYGTWIVASLLSRLLSGDEVDYKSTFLNTQDFIAVISGEFDNEKLTVNDRSIGVMNKYIWIKENDTWVRMYAEP